MALLTSSGSGSWLAVLKSLIKTNMYSSSISSRCWMRDSNSIMRALRSTGESNTVVSAIFKSLYFNWEPFSSSTYSKTASSRMSTESIKSCPCIKSSFFSAMVQQHSKFLSHVCKSGLPSTPVNLGKREKTFS